MSSTADAAIEARVKARLDAEKIDYEGRIQAARDGLVQATENFRSYRAAADKAFDKLAERIDAGKTPTEGQAQGALDYAGGLKAHVRDLLAATGTLDDLVHIRKGLDSKGELDRRVKQAKDYDPESDEPLTQVQAVELVLLRAGRPMHYREVTRIGLETGLIRTAGATPEATVSAMLATRALKGDRFRKVEAGIFDLLPVEGAKAEEVAS